MAPNRNQRFALSLILLLMIQRRRRRRQQPIREKRLWVRSWIARRQHHGVFHRLLTELRLEDELNYRSYLRLNEDQFNEPISWSASNFFPRFE